MVKATIPWEDGPETYYIGQDDLDDDLIIEYLHLGDDDCGNEENDDWNEKYKFMRHTIGSILQTFRNHISCFDDKNGHIPMEYFEKCYLNIQ